MVNTSENLLFLPQCQSTNDEAWAALAAGKAGHGCMFYTHTQTAGRGQRGTSWEAEPGQNLLCSTLLNINQKVEIDALFDLSRACSLAIAGGISAWTKGVVTPQLKWPNDLYVQGKKLGGILLENRWNGTGPEWAVIGLGLNVNQTAFPPTLPATSLQLLTGATYNIHDGARILCQAITESLALLQNPADLRPTYERALAGIGTTGQFSEGDGPTFEAILLGTTPAGQLRLLTEKGEKRYDLKEVRQVMG